MFKFNTLLFFCCQKVSNFPEKHTAAMNLAEAAFLAKLQDDSEQALQLTKASI